MCLFSCSSFNRNLQNPMKNLFKYLTTTETKYAGCMAMAMAPIVIFIILATLCFARAYYTSCGYKRNETGPRVLSRSMSIGALHGGKLAFQRLIDFHEARADVALLYAAQAEIELQTLLEEKHPDFNKMQRIVGKLEMSGKETETVRILESALRMAQKEGRSVEAYEIEMLLVEMLIYKGDFEKALKSKCLKDEKISDARRPLYKAIIHILLDDPNEEAKKCWEEFREIRRHFQSRPSSQDSHNIHETTMNFDKFERAVKLLKQDIHAAQERTS